MEQHPEVAAIGCAQAEADGRPWPAGMQPAPVSHRCRVPSYIGFAHVLRRRHVSGGGRLSGGASLLRRGKDLLRAPAARRLSRRLHARSTRGACARSRRPQHRHGIFGMWSGTIVCSRCTTCRGRRMCVSLPVRLARYFSMRSASSVRDRTGFVWIVAQLCRAFPGAVRARTPMTWSNVSEWRRLRRDAPPWPAYDAPGQTAVAHDRPLVSRWRSTGGCRTRSHARTTGTSRP